MCSVLLNYKALSQFLCLVLGIFLDKKNAPYLGDFFVVLLPSRGLDSKMAIKRYGPKPTFKERTKQN